MNFKFAMIFLLILTCAFLFIQNKKKWNPLNCANTQANNDARHWFFFYSIYILAVFFPSIIFHRMYALDAMNSTTHLLLKRWTIDFVQRILRGILNIAVGFTIVHFFHDAIFKMSESSSSFVIHFQLNTMPLATHLTFECLALCTYTIQQILCISF